MTKNSKYRCNVAGRFLDLKSPFISITFKKITHAVGKHISIHRDWYSIEFVLGIDVHGTTHSIHAEMIPIESKTVLMIFLNFK